MAGRLRRSGRHGSRPPGGALGDGDDTASLDHVRPAVGAASQRLASALDEVVNEPQVRLGRARQHRPELIRRHQIPAERHARFDQLTHTVMFPDRPDDRRHQLGSPPRQCDVMHRLTLQRLVPVCERIRRQPPERTSIGTGVQKTPMGQHDPARRLPHVTHGRLNMTSAERRLAIRTCGQANVSAPYGHTPR